MRRVGLKLYFLLGVGNDYLGTRVLFFDRYVWLPRCMDLLCLGHVNCGEWGV